MPVTAGYAPRCKASPDRLWPTRPCYRPTSWVCGLKTAALGCLLASQGCDAGAPPSTPGAWAPALPSPAPAWRPSVGCEFEIYGNDAAQLDRVVASAGVRTAPPMQLGYSDAARLWFGHGLSIPHKGSDLGAWRVVPELAFPLDTHEVVSPALSVDRVDEVRAVADALTQNGRRTPGDGAFHVHVAHAGLNASALADLTQLWGTHHALLFALSNTNLRQQQLYARPPPEAFLQMLNALPPRTLSELHAHYIHTHQPLSHLGLTFEARRFYALNLHYLASGATVEFRAYQFVDRPAADMAMAYIDLSVALMAAVRDGSAARLAHRSLHPSDDAAALLDALRVPEPSCALLLRNTQRYQGFAFFDGELRTAVTEGLLGSFATAVLLGTEQAPSMAIQGIRWVAEGMVLTSGLHVGALALEAAGLTTYVATYAAREWSLLHFLRIGLGVRAVAAFY